MLVLSKRSSRPQISLFLEGKAIPQVESHKHLGLIFDSNLTWSLTSPRSSSRLQRNSVYQKSIKLGLLHRFNRRLPRLSIRILYTPFIRTSLEYSAVALSGMSKVLQDQLEAFQRSAARLITGSSLSDRLPADILLARAGLERLSTRRKRTCVMFAFKLSDGSVPEHLTDEFDHFVSETSERRVQLRPDNLRIPRLPRPHSELLRHSPSYFSPSLLKSIPSVHIKNPTLP